MSDEQPDSFKVTAETFRRRMDEIIREVRESFAALLAPAEDEQHEGDDRQDDEQRPQHDEADTRELFLRIPMSLLKPGFFLKVVDTADPSDTTVAR